jgi:hypothetical protein
MDLKAAHRRQRRSHNRRVKHLGFFVYLTSDLSRLATAATTVVIRGFPTR